MKLFFLLLFLICAGCGGDSAKDVDNSGGDEAGGKAEVQSVEITLTHKADNDEDVFISYEKPESGKKVTNFEIQPGQCIIFKKEQFQFVKDIKFGDGWTGRGGNLGFGTITGCGSNVDAGELSCKGILSIGSYEIRDIGTVFDTYILKPSERNTSSACQYFEDIL